MKIWAVSNQKGGVGKTTTTVSLAGLLAEQGHRVLMIDIDPQGSLSSYFNYDPETIQKSSLNLFTADNITRAQVQTLIQTTQTASLSLMPAGIGLATLERKGISNGMGMKLSTALNRISTDFDYVLIDSPPGLGVLMINALAACDHLLVPVQTEFLALKGLERMMKTIGMVSKSLKMEMRYTIIPTMYDQRTRASVMSLQTLQETYGDKVWSSVIPIDTRFREASKQGQTPSHYDSQSHGVAAYDRLLTVLLKQQENNHISRFDETRVA